MAVKCSNRTLWSTADEDGYPYWAEFEDSPFTKGNSKFMYKGRLNGKGPRSGEYCTVKVFRSIDIAKHEDWSSYVNRIQTANKLAAQFNKMIDNQYTVKFMVPTLALIDISSTCTDCMYFLSNTKRIKSDDCVAIEPYIGSKFRKFYRNSPLKGAEYAYILQAFSHFTASQTGDTLVCGLQGQAHGTEFLLTNPIIHSANQEWGPKDQGAHGFRKFFSAHTCNEICQTMDLPEYLETMSVAEEIDQETGNKSLELTELETSPKRFVSTDNIEPEVVQPDASSLPQTEAQISDTSSHTKETPTILQTPPMSRVGRTISAPVSMAISLNRSSSVTGPPEFAEELPSECISRPTESVILDAIPIDDIATHFSDSTEVLPPPSCEYQGPFTPCQTVSEYLELKKNQAPFSPGSASIPMIDDELACAESELMEAVPPPTDDFEPTISPSLHSYLRDKDSLEIIPHGSMELDLESQQSISVFEDNLPAPDLGSMNNFQMSPRESITQPVEVVENYTPCDTMSQESLVTTPCGTICQEVESQQSVVSTTKDSELQDLVPVSEPLIEASSYQIPVRVEIPHDIESQVCLVSIPPDCMDHHLDTVESLEALSSPASEMLTSAEVMADPKFSLEEPGEESMVTGNGDLAEEQMVLQECSDAQNFQETDADHFEPYPADNVEVGVQKSVSVDSMSSDFKQSLETIPEGSNESDSAPSIDISEMPVEMQDDTTMVENNDEIIADNQIIVSTDTTFNGQEETFSEIQPSSTVDAPETSVTEETVMHDTTASEEVIVEPVTEVSTEEGVHICEETPIENSVEPVCEATVSQETTVETNVEPLGETQEVAVESSVEPVAVETEAMASQDTTIETSVEPEGDTSEVTTVETIGAVTTIDETNAGETRESEETTVETLGAVTSEEATVETVGDATCQETTVETIGEATYSQDTVGESTSEETAVETIGEATTSQEMTVETGGEVTTSQETTVESGGEVTTCEETAVESGGEVTTCEETAVESGGEVTTCEETAVESGGEVTTSQETTVESGGEVTTSQETTVESGGEVTTSQETTVESGGEVTTSQETAVESGGEVTTSQETTVESGGEVTTSQETTVESGGEVTTSQETTVESGGEVTTCEETAVESGGEVTTSQETTVESGGEVTTSQETTVVSGGEVTTCEETAVESGGEVTTCEETTVEREGEVTTSQETTVESGGEVTTCEETAVESGGEVTTSQETTVESGGEVTTCEETAVESGGEVTTSQEINVETGGEVTTSQETNVEIDGEVTTSVENNAETGGETTTSQETNVETVCEATTSQETTVETGDEVTTSQENTVEIVGEVTSQETMPQETTAETIKSTVEDMSSQGNIPEPVCESAVQETAVESRIEDENQGDAIENTTIDTVEKSDISQEVTEPTIQQSYVCKDTQIGEVNVCQDTVTESNKEANAVGTVYQSCGFVFTPESTEGNAGQSSTIQVTGDGYVSQNYWQESSTGETSACQEMGDGSAVLHENSGFGTTVETIGEGYVCQDSAGETTVEGSKVTETTESTGFEPAMQCYTNENIDFESNVEPSADGYTSRDSGFGSVVDSNLTGYLNSEQSFTVTSDNNLGSNTYFQSFPSPASYPTEGMAATSSQSTNPYYYGLPPEYRIYEDCGSSQSETSCPLRSSKMTIIPDLDSMEHVETKCLDSVCEECDMQQGIETLPRRTVSYYLEPQESHEIITFRINIAPECPTADQNPNGSTLQNAGTVCQSSKSGELSLGSADCCSSCQACETSKNVGEGSGRDTCSYHYSNAGDCMETMPQRSCGYSSEVHQNVSADWSTTHSTWDDSYCLTTQNQQTASGETVYSKFDPNV